jgi:hypothetical protein
VAVWSALLPKGKTFAGCPAKVQFPIRLFPVRGLHQSGWGNRKNRMKEMSNKIKRGAVVVAATSIGAASAFAQTTFADPSTITTTATTVFTAVASLMVGIVGFWVVLKIVRKISGK